MNVQREEVVVGLSSRRRARLLTGAVALTGGLTLTVAATVPTAAASAPAPEAPTEPAATEVDGGYAVFNSPGPNGERDFAVEEDVVGLVRDTPDDATIHGAMFSWTRDNVVDELVAAAERGVEIHLAIDSIGSNGTNSDPDNVAIQKIRDNEDVFAQVTWCEGTGSSDDQKSACIGDRSYSINHNKLFSFSETGGMSDVIWSSSQNFTYSQNNNFNNAVVVHGDPELYAFFGRHFDNLLAQRKDNDYFNSPDGYYRTEDLSVTVYFSPRLNSSGGGGVEARTDTVRNVLTYIGSQQGDCRLDVAHAQFTNPRHPVADQLVRIAGLGCQVRVVYTSMGDQVFARLSNQANIELKRYDDNRPENENRIGVHSKYISFSGTYNEKPDRDLIYTGSHNLTGPALRNHDETLMKIEIPQITDAYEANFTEVWERARCANPSSGSCP